MLKFSTFIKESMNYAKTQEMINHMINYPTLHNFLWHLTSPDAVDGEFTTESRFPNMRPVGDVKAAGLENQPEGNPWQHIKKGFHDAFPDGEDEATTKRKGIEAQNHFANFMKERGGYSGKKVALLSQNGKTASSATEGTNTVGLALAPHTSSGYKHNLCPKASSECAENCLGFTAGGNKQYPEDSFRAKLLRTQYLHEHPEHAARLMSKEIGENEKWSSEHETVHNKAGELMGYRHKASGRIVSENPSGIGEEMMHEGLKSGTHMLHPITSGKKAKTHMAVFNQDGEHVGFKHIKTGNLVSNNKLPNNEQRASIKQKLDSGEYHTRSLKSGVRLNVTSDLPYESLMPKKFFDRHKATQFYDYTKVAGRLDKPRPSNYFLALSHTGGNHAESNDKDVVKALHAGHVVAMVHQKSDITPTHVEDVQTGHRWPIVGGDADDEIPHRHHQAGIPKTKGVVSALKLKGVKNEAAGAFANKVDDDGVIRINKPRDQWEHQRPAMGSEREAARKAGII